MNDHLLSRPDLLNNLVGILSWFKEGKCAAVSNTEQMFHQINVRPEDQDALRFLWWGDKIKAIEDHKTVCTSIGKNWFPMHSQLDIEKETARDSEEVICENIIDQINCNFYMDNFLSL